MSVEPNYEFWRKQPIYTALEAAYLMANTEPQPANDTPPPRILIQSDSIENQANELGIKGEKTPTGACELRQITSPVRLMGFGESNRDVPYTTSTVRERVTAAGFSKEELSTVFTAMGEKLPWFLDPSVETGNPNNVKSGRALREDHSANREHVLGAAMALLAKNPGSYRSGTDMVIAAQLAKAIDENGLKFWPKTGQPPLAIGTIEGLLREWIKKAD